MMASPVLGDDQARLLEDALIAVRQQTALMRKCLDTPGKLMDALKCWSVKSFQGFVTTDYAPTCYGPTLHQS
jgi:hypothetical protein